MGSHSCGTYPLVAVRDMSNYQENQDGSFTIRKWLVSLTRLPKESVLNTFVVALSISLFCSLIVTTLAVVLKPLQLENQEQEQQRYLLQIFERQPGIKQVFESVDAQSIEIKLVNLATGQYVQNMNPDGYNQRQAARDPGQSVAIAPKDDIAKLKRRAKYAPVYLVRKSDSIAFIILPVHGRGFTSTLYGYLGVDVVKKTVIGLNFYEHKETPGLGARVGDQEWLTQWRGKLIWDSEGKLKIGVVRGKVLPGTPDSVYQVDGISGATWTSRSVHNLVRFWLGEKGFGLYLKNQLWQEML